MNIDNNTLVFKNKSMCNYDKKKLFVALKTTILNELYDESVYFFHEIFISGYFKELYEFYINFFLLYIHTSNPSLLSVISDKYFKFLEISKTYKKNNVYIIKLRNSENFFSDLFFIFKNIYYSVKYDYVKLIPPYYIKNTDKIKIFKQNGRTFYNNGSIIKEIYDDSNVELIQNNLLNFEKYLKLLFQKKYKNDNEFFTLKNQTFHWFSKFINDEFYETNTVISPTRLTIKYVPNNKTIKNFIPKIWNIILNISSYDRYIYDQIKLIYGFDSKNVVCSKIALTVSILYFIINYNKSMNLKLKNIDYEDKEILSKLTNNVNESLRNFKIRNDFIQLSTEKKKKVNNVQKNIKKNNVNKKIKKIIKEKPKQNIKKKNNIIKENNKFSELFKNIDIIDTNCFYNKNDAKNNINNIVQEFKPLNLANDNNHENNINLIINKIND